MSLALVDDRKGIRHPATKSLHQLPFVDCTFPPLLIMHHRPFCLSRTWWNGVKEDVWREGEWRGTGYPVSSARMVMHLEVVDCGAKMSIVSRNGWLDFGMSTVRIQELFSLFLTLQRCTACMQCMRLTAMRNSTANGHVLHLGRPLWEIQILDNQPVTLV